MSDESRWNAFRAQINGFSSRTVLRTSSGQNWTAEDVMNYFTTGTNRHVSVASTVNVDGQERWAPIKLDRSYMMNEGIGRLVDPSRFDIVLHIMEGRVPFSSGETLEVIAKRAATMGLASRSAFDDKGRALPGDQAVFRAFVLGEDAAESFVFGSTAFRITGRAVKDENGNIKIIGPESFGNDTGP